MTGIPWPWARVAQQQRTFLWLAIFLISASGLITGLAAHSLTHSPRGSTPMGMGSTTGTDTPAVGTVTATSAPAVTKPQQFAILLTADTPATRGSTMTVVANAVVADHYDPTNGLPVGDPRPAQGVTCQISFSPAGGITPPAVQKTDVSGTASFAIAIPATTPPGTYTIRVHATWSPGGFGADRNLLVKITG